MYPPYGPYPPRRDNTARIVVVIVLALVAVFLVVPIILGAVLFGTMSGPFPQRDEAEMYLGDVELRNGTASIFVYLWPDFAPADLRFSFFVNGSGPSNLPIPSPDQPRSVAASTYAILVSWLDETRDGRMNSGDWFRIAGDPGPLPAATRFDFTLQASDGSIAASVGWMTP
jgi:hypothetical protein